MLSGVEKSRANIIPPKKGEVRNPKGKPKGTKNVSTIIRQFLECDIDFKDIRKNGGQEGKGTILEAMISTMIAKAIKVGDVQAFEKVLDRFEGKSEARSKVKVEGDLNNNAVAPVIIIKGIAGKDDDTGNNNTK